MNTPEALQQRIDELKAKRRARLGRPGLSDNVRAVDQEIERLEGELKAVQAEEASDAK